MGKFVLLEPPGSNPGRFNTRKTSKDDDPMVVNFTLAFVSVSTQRGNSYRLNNFLESVEELL